MERQATVGLAPGLYNYLYGSWRIVLMTGAMPENNEMIRSLQDMNTVFAMFEDQVLCEIPVVLNRTADYQNHKAVIQMAGDAIEIEQNIDGDVTWAIMSRTATRNSDEFMMTNKVGLWDDSNAIIVMDDLSNKDTGEKRILKAVTVSIQEVQPTEEVEEV